VNYDNDYDWSQWNMTGKIRILMESNAAPPMAQYSIATKTTGSAATPMSSLTSSRMSYSACPAALPMQHSTVRSNALAGPNPTHDPFKASTPQNSEVVALPQYSQEASPLLSQHSEATLKMYDSDDIPQSQDSRAPSKMHQDLNAMNKENSLGFEDADWDGKQKSKQKVWQHQRKLDIWVC
jgi:hypothetical protein